jgi:hypothetical protein
MRLAPQHLQCCAYSLGISNPFYIKYKHKAPKELRHYSVSFFQSRWICRIAPTDLQSVVFHCGFLIRYNHNQTIFEKPSSKRSSLFLKICPISVPIPSPKPPFPKFSNQNNPLKKKYFITNNQNYFPLFFIIEPLISTRSLKFQNQIFFDRNKFILNL